VYETRATGGFAWIHRHALDLEEYFLFTVFYSSSLTYTHAHLHAYSTRCIHIYMVRNTTSDSMLLYYIYIYIYIYIYKNNFLYTQLTKGGVMAPIPLMGCTFGEMGSNCYQKKIRNFFITA
jgi:hypothetical protein